MNKNKIPLILIALLIVVGLGYFAFSINEKGSKNNSINNTPSDTNNTIPSKDEYTESTINGTIMDLMNMGKSIKCSFSNSGEDVAVSGSNYISGKKMKGEFQMGVNGQVIKSSVVSDGNYMYMWNEGSNSGIKIKLQNTIDIKSNENLTQDINQTYNYKCSNWTVDNKFFEVPNTVSFTDFSSVPNTVPTFDGNSALCASCDDIKDLKARSQCRTNLNCK